MANGSGALDGIQVIDCSEGVAGPFAAMILGDFGADVIKVEPPGGDRARSNPGFAVWNRNKHGIVLDVRRPAELEQLHALLAGADVCVFGQPLAELERWRLDPQSLEALNPSTVYVHLPAFTAEGPLSGFDESAELLAAISGIGFKQYSDEDVPVDPVIPSVLYTQGIWAALTTTATLLERASSGRGQTVTVSGMHAALALSTQVATETDTMRVPELRPGGGGGSVPFIRVYECGDGRWLVLAALSPAFYTAAFTILDLLDILADHRIQGEGAAMNDYTNAGWVIERMASAFRARPRAEWLELLRDAGVPSGPIEDRASWFDHEQVAALGMRVPVDDPERGRVEMAGIPLQASSSPGSIRSAAPVLGQHQTLVTPRAPRPRVPAPAPAAGVLAGIRVLDLGVVVAGSYGGSLLAEMGADVMKLEPPDGGDVLRGYGLSFFGYNKGKRSIALRLDNDAGREVFYRLVRDADVVIDNYRPGVLERLQIDHERLERMNPGIVSVSVTGYGGVGPLGQDPGFDPVLQGASGIMLAQGGDSGPVYVVQPVIDAPAAMMAALGACLGLLGRSKSGRGSRITTSLAALSVFVQTAEIVRFDGRPPARSGGRDYQGPNPLDRYYRVRDGWIRIQGGPGTGPAVVAAAGLSPAAAVAPDAQLTASLVAALEGLDGATALAGLREHGVPAVPAYRGFREWADELATAGEEAMHEVIDGGGVRVYGVGRLARFSRCQRSDRTLPPGLGEHTTEILSEAGYDGHEIERLVRDGVVAVGKPFAI